MNTQARTHFTTPYDLCRRRTSPVISYEETLGTDAVRLRIAGPDGQRRAVLGVVLFSQLLLAREFIGQLKRL